MGKKTKTPDPMDSVARGQAEWNANQAYADQQTIANRPQQSNQYGDLTWSQDPTTGAWTQTNTLKQPQQDIFNRQQSNQLGIANTIGDMLGQMDLSQVDLSGAPQMPGVVDYNQIGGMMDFSKLGDMPQIGQYNQQATDLYNKLAQPGLDKQRAAKEAQMAAMGLSLGSGQAYNTQQELLNDSANRSGMMGAQAGIQQGNIMFGQGMDKYRQSAQNYLNQYNRNAQNLENQFAQGMGVHQQGVSDILNQKQANMAQLSGLMGLGQNVGVPQYGNFSQASNAPWLNINQAATQGALNQANAQNADNAGKTQAAAAVAGAAIAAF